MNAIFIYVIVYSALRLIQFFKTIDLSNFKDTCISIFTQIRKLRHFTENQKVIKTENTRKCRQIQEYELLFVVAVEYSHKYIVLVEYSHKM